MTLVSLLTPVFNEERYLPAMLASVRAQTHEHWELLAVDDGSGDATPRLVAEAAAADPRIRVVSSGRKIGKVAAFNAAFGASSGDIICHVGGDDELVPESLAVRVAALADHADKRAVAFFKILMVDEATGRQTVHPRGRRGNMSGPSITMSRPLAELVFPVPADLVSEDIWMGHVAAALADVRIDSPEIVIHYRVHAGNSNPRAKPFAAMSAAMHARAKAMPRMLTAQRFELPEAVRVELAQQWRAELMRRDGRVLALLRYHELPLMERLAFASMSNPPLWWIRRHLGHRAGGWRGR